MSLSARTEQVVRQWLHDYAAAKEVIDVLNSSTSSAPAGGTTGQVLTKLSGADFDLGWADSGATGTPRQVPWFNASGVLQALPGYDVDPDTGGVRVGLNFDPIDAEYWNIHADGYNLRPTADSANGGVNIHNINVQLDPDSSGFDINVGSGTAAGIFNLSFGHGGTSDVGGVTFFSNSFEIGNDVDPINVGGLSYMYGFGSFHSNVTITGPLQGYGFQCNMADGSSMSSSAYVNGFYDNANLQAAIPSYTSFAAGPQIKSIQNNHNYSALQVNPNILTFTGNAGFTGIGVYGQLGTVGTGFVSGIQVSPNVTSCQNAAGISINMNNVTASGNKKAIDATGDVYINGALQFTGALSIGQLNAFANVTAADNGGNPATVHGLVSSVTGPANTTVANADTLGVNTAMLMQINTNCALTSGPLSIGLAALALPCVVEMHTGSTVDFMSGAVYALNLSNTATGGTIDTANVARSVVIPNGITTINKARGFYYSEPFGAVATKSHGIYLEDAPAYMEVGVLIGGTPVSDDVLAASAALEVRSTTGAILFSRMTTTERNALTAANGMVVYNTTTDKLQVRAAGSWVDLH